jgi:hypothetical protein
MHTTHYLLGNAFGLKLHWIYDRAYLHALSLKDDLFTLNYDPVHFKDATNAYDCYPNQVLGDTTTQGVIARLLKDIYHDKKTLCLNDYHTLIQNMFLLPSYVGYQESFIKAYIKRVLDTSDTLLDDDHTVYFIPYVVTKDLKVSKALGALFNDHHRFDKDLEVLHTVMTYIKELGMKGAYLKALEIKEIDSIYHEILKAKSLEDVILMTGTHCSIRVLMPLVYYMCMTYTLKEALYHNFLIGGSISERAGYLTMILGEIEAVPNLLRNIHLK